MGGAHCAAPGETRASSAWVRFSRCTERPGGVEAGATTATAPIGAEVTWANFHGKNNGATYTQPAVNGFKPPALYEVKDQNVLSGMFSVRRFF